MPWRGLIKPDGGLITSAHARARAIRLRHIADEFPGDLGLQRIALDLAAEMDALAERLEIEGPWSAVAPA